MEKKSAPDAQKLYDLQENMSACVLFSLSSKFYLICDKDSADIFKDEFTPSLKAYISFKFSQDVTLNHVREKGKFKTNICL